MFEKDLGHVCVVRGVMDAVALETVLLDAYPTVPPKQQCAMQAQN